MIAALGLALVVIGVLRIRSSEDLPSAFAGMYAVMVGLIATTLGLWLD